MLPVDGLGLGLGFGTGLDAVVERGRCTAAEAVLAALMTTGDEPRAPRLGTLRSPTLDDGDRLLGVARGLLLDWIEAPLFGFDSIVRLRRLLSDNDCVSRLPRGDAAPISFPELEPTDTAELVLLTVGFGATTAGLAGGLGFSLTIFGFGAVTAGFVAGTAGLAVGVGLGFAGSSGLTGVTTADAVVGTSTTGLGCGSACMVGVVESTHGLLSDSAGAKAA